MFIEYSAQHLSQYFTQDEASSLNAMLDVVGADTAQRQVISNQAAEIIQKIRKTKRKTGSLESFFQQYSLSTKEGLALMSLAEALLRIPDSMTAEALIKDKLSDTDWISNTIKDGDWLTRMTGLGLHVSEGTINSIFEKLGAPVIHHAMRHAMTMMGGQFVIGETIEKAQEKATQWDRESFRFSYDMLGEGARTMGDADRYFAVYKAALLDLTQDRRGVETYMKPNGLSVKLSAIHPRYELSQMDQCAPILVDRLLQLCTIAAEHNLTLTIDAEEVARLIPSLEIFEQVLAKIPKSWGGFGLAVQAYQKAAPHVIDHVIALAQQYDRKIQVRLVKGAYWDTEIRHAQLAGHEDYPVYTRKAHSDVSYLFCAQKLLQAHQWIYPMFGTHNAHSVAAIMQSVEALNILHDHFEFQKLFGMGDALYNIVQDHYPGIGICVYAPVGPHSDLLPYLVRRMLENGANSSFVNQIYSPDFTPEMIAVDPIDSAAQYKKECNDSIPLPSDLYAPERVNSSGIDFDDPAVLKRLCQHNGGIPKAQKGLSLVLGKAKHAVTKRESINPSDHADIIGITHDYDRAALDCVFETAHAGFEHWSQVTAHQRAQILEKIADLYEENHDDLLHLITREGGRTLKDAHDEIREAVDFCRYYAMRGRVDCHELGVSLTSPTGESNIHSLQPRGVFVAISPWNFPFAIFTGQIVAALMVGNSVIAKPAEQTPFVAIEAVKLMHQAGIPKEALSLVLGDGEMGAALVEHDQVAGVVFTGSSKVAKSIQRCLAQKEGAIVPLIAETGGMNAMIVDSSALTEQVVDDVIQSAFGSAGQRCSACRILYLQEEIADKTISMLQGAMDEIRIGNPADPRIDVGPLIDADAMALAQNHKAYLDQVGKKIAECNIDRDLKGSFFAPCAYEIEDITALKEEVFAPILHVIRYKRKDIDHIIRHINDTGYGLTFGVHSRDQAFIQHVLSHIRAGNIYVNRGTIGAVVGVQPFGGQGLSGTGPKAGGAYYLKAFATEKVISTDLTAAGGNAALMMGKH